MMKKVVKTAAFLLVTTALFAKTQVTFWHGIESPVSIEVLESKIEQFEKSHPDIDVVAQNYGAADQVNSKIMTAVAGNKAPNLMWWGPSFTGQMAKTGKLVKVQDFIDKDKDFNKDDIYKGLWEVSNYKGEAWTIPFDANNLGLYYNKKHFREMGIDPNSIKTWDDLLEVSKKLTNDQRFGFQVPLGKGEWTVWTWQTLLWQAGGEFLTVPKYTSAVFDSEAGINALNFWTDLVHKHKVATFSEPDTGYKTDDFLAGRISMMINGPWNYGTLQQAEKENGFEYGVLMLPKAGSYAAVGNGRNATNIGGENLFMFKTNAEEEQASWEFSKFIMSPDFQVEWAMKTGYLPVCASAEQDPEYKAFLEKNEFIKVYVDQMKYGKARPSVPEYGKISTTLGKEIEKALYQKSSAKDALRKAATYSNRLLKKADR